MTQPKKPAICYVCHEDCEGDFHALAQHWNTKRKEKEHRKHRNSLIWAAHFLMNTKKLNKKKDEPQRMKLTEQEKENKQSMYREISGEVEAVKILCCHCKRSGSGIMPIEYTRSPYAWRTNSGTLITTCRLCVR